MDFLKDLLQIQHELILKQIAPKILKDDYDINQFINKYNKKNYCTLRIGNYKMKSVDCVKMKELLSTLD